ncbi:tRNA glutamyl-Q(34) synthetase GluQRS [Saccharospirillum salsuginis]|uniref:Glutamyl-Q tRNA(Asp) synthetase n=1 Tax=Saccharospirillum salsuginis TaxID=418750 RepID=A0A918N7W1_9GAMM|nr:tRNA glutamyl-Q(34) synthetase GluQRS [Saccharospirillum salsuginis]GGX45733.1 glutamyl-Q tRNA(Asp) synthetase [Saccharospirillum salsuginis]
MSQYPAYIGRFAPSPTGPLHHGSLLAAVISYLDARKHQGRWLVRIEDLDPPREQPGAAASILHSLEAHGLHWDGEVRYQSERGDAFEAALARLADKGRLFWCQCSRKQLGGQPVYPGTCHAYDRPRPDCAIRFRVPDREDRFDDLLQGWQSAHLGRDYGDVVVKRRDGPYAYQLAVTVDDLDQGITDVIRGIDLQSSTFWQRALFDALDAEPPRYGHFPVLIGPDGQKLSKQNRAPAIDDTRPSHNLHQVLRFLDLDVAEDRPDIMLAQAVNAWSRATLMSRDAIIP